MTGTGWIDRLGLQAHPEGGWFRRLYTDPREAGGRPLASSIHYLLAGPQRLGRLHRNRSTILHFLQSGGPVEYLQIEPGQEPRRTRLAFDGALFLSVPGGVWKGSRLLDGAEHALVSEVVIPGFDWQDHEYLDPTELARWRAAYGIALAPWAGG
ncbi:MAG TPA: cupin domain-containing protein [Nevskiaceae bacterium]|nr:cupin domain-containing protein [Nevskiaceae bacterium]